METWKRNLIVCWFGSFATTAGMNLVIPFLPLFIKELGVHRTANIEQWAGSAFAATFLLSAIVSPIWGRVADRRGRKLMLLRASLGMAIVMTLIGFVHNVYELVLLRFLMGAVSGYIAAAIALVATQTPETHSGWALGTLSTGAVGGTLLGPLIGGWLVGEIGLRHVFFATGSFLLLSFGVTWLFVQEEFVNKNEHRSSMRQVFRSIGQPGVVVSLFLTTFMFQFANMSIEPIVTVYVRQLSHSSNHVALISGAVFSASGLASIIAAPQLGRLSDKFNARHVLFVCLVASGLLFIPQGFVSSPWQLMGLRFLTGLFIAGMLPSINYLIKTSVPNSVAGRIFGYNQSAQYLGNIAGAMVGGQLAAFAGFRAVFFSTSGLLLLNGFWLLLGSSGTTLARSQNL
ncbi:multidrug efflux MFS transporter [Alicyclobacillus curvatus]|nr:multidrug efflux MFS transporter [Alicyclobacillus curvatus]